MQMRKDPNISLIASPSELMFKFGFRIIIDIIKLNLSQDLRTKQGTQ